MPKRESTNSITHLVKIIANEVFDARLSEVPNNIDDKLEDIKSSLENAGDFWDKKEDALLLHEVIIAVAQISKNHGRTREAIRRRISDRGIF